MSALASGRVAPRLRNRSQRHTSVTTRHLGTIAGATSVHASTRAKCPPMMTRAALCLEPLPSLALRMRCGRPQRQPNAHGPCIKMVHVAPHPQWRTHSCDRHAHNCSPQSCTLWAKTRPRVRPPAPAPLLYKAAGNRERDHARSIEPSFALVCWRTAAAATEEAGCCFGLDTEH